MDGNSAEFFPEGLILDIARQGGRSPKRTSKRDEFLIQCPWAERHRNGDGHPSCRLDAGKNVFYCDPCGEGGGIKGLASALGVSLHQDAGSHGELKAKKRLLFTGSGSVTETTATPCCSRKRLRFKKSRRVRLKRSNL